ncbi:MAG: enoyl-CoA hydratase/isomerase family protein [Sphingomonadales bacterium]|nr:enoyl-CoA hydratase/isomerase family protein [Sphingomonadales bacterium]
MTETPRLLRHDADGLCTLTLNRPEKLNALDTQTFAELDAQLAALESQTDSIGCVVLKGAGRAFCAGADLNAFGAGGVAKTYKPKIVERLAALPQPVIAAVHGTCMTGGLEIALAADLILADPSARFADTHGKWGFVGEWGMTQRLPRRVGPANARRLMFTAQPVDAAEAHRIGLVDLIADDLDALTATVAAQILGNSWHTNVANKRLLRETDGMTLEQGLAHEHYYNPGFAPDWEARVARFSKK